MARVTGADKIYEVAGLFRSRCLTQGSSLLWPNEHAWTPDSISALLDAFIGHPDTGKRSFLEKWHDQLAQQPESVHRVAADIVAFYYLFLSNVRPETKLERVESVISWKLVNQQPDLALLKQAYARGIGGAGALYMMAEPAQLAFFLEFARDALSQGTDLADPAVCKRLADEVGKKVRQSGGARHVLLHLLFPDQFERIASEEHKRLIAKAFHEDAGNTEDVDEALANIRRALSERVGRENVDFYDDDIKRTWWPSTDSGKGGNDKGAMEPDAKRLEIGRTLLVGAAGTPDAGAIDIAGEGRLAKDQGRLAVWWSFPATGDKEQAIADWPYLYLYQRQPLQQITHRYHIVERATSKGDAGILCPWPEYAEEQYRDKTRAGGRPDEVFKTWFLVDRVEELGPPIALAELEKADGTPAVPGALRGGFGLWKLKEHVRPTDRLGELSARLFLDRDYLATIERLLEDKGQVIFFGPPGTGKTYVAQELARLYAGTAGQVEIVQFHPSYAYEDFVEGYRPRATGGFALADGPLKRIARAARKNPTARHVLIIDEINRGNVAKVLGELYFLLEYRSEEICLQYSEEPFELPENLWIIGTMNTADRSIALVDSALRRRFYFVPFSPSEPPIKDVLRRWLQRHKPELVWVADVVDEANRLLHDEDAAIGPSYFLKSDLTEEWVGLIWKHAILPYVAERLYGETERFDDFDLGLLRAGHTSRAEAQGEEIAPTDAL